MPKKAGLQNNLDKLAMHSRDLEGQQVDAEERQAQTRSAKMKSKLAGPKERERNLRAFTVQGSPAT